MPRRNRRRIEKHGLGFNPERYIQQNIKRLPRTKDVRRGEVWFAELGQHPGTSVEEGCRPVLVISNDTANVKSESVTVIPMTTKMKKYYIPTHVPVPETILTDTKPENRFRDCMLLAEQITTISRSAFRNCLGRIRDPEKMAEIEAAVMAQMAISKPLSGDDNDTDEGIEPEAEEAGEIEEAGDTADTADAEDPRDSGEPGENMGIDTDDQEDL